MKKKIFLSIMVMLLAFALVFVGCGDDDPTTDPGTDPVTDPALIPDADGNWTVKFDLNGGKAADGSAITIEDIKVPVENDGIGRDNFPDAEPVLLPAFGTQPAKLAFDGWYDGDTEYTRSTKITKNVTLKAEYEAAMAFTIPTKMAQFGTSNDDAYDMTAELILIDIDDAKFLDQDSMDAVWNAEPYSVIRIFIVNANSANRNGWGCGAATYSPYGWVDADGEEAEEDDVGAIQVPRSINIAPNPMPGYGITYFDMDVDVIKGDIQKGIDDGVIDAPQLNINTWNQLHVWKAQLWEPNATFEEPRDYDLELDQQLYLGEDDDIEGFDDGAKSIGPVSMAILDYAKAHKYARYIVVRLTLTNTAGEDRSGWGCGNFGGAGFNGVGVGGGTQDVSVVNITGNGANVYNGCEVTKIELWIPKFTDGGEELDWDPPASVEP